MTSKHVQTFITFLYFALIIITPLTWLSTTSELFEFPKMMLVYISTILILMAWLMRMLMERRLIFKPSYLDIPLLIFIASQIISTIFSIHPPTSLHGYYSRFHGGLLSSLSYTALYWAAISNLKASSAKHFLIALLISLGLTSVYSFPEHFGLSPSCILVSGQPDVACWVQDVQTRVYGTFGQPNWQAAFIILLFFLPLGLLIDKLKDSWLTLKSPSTHLLIALLALSTSVLIFTKSRSGLLGLAIGAIVFGLGALPSLKNTSQRLRLFPIFGVSILSGLILFTLFGRTLFPRFDTLIDQLRMPNATTEIVNPMAAVPTQSLPSGTQLMSGGSESGDIRRIVWQGAWDLFVQKPLIGHGLETFGYTYYNVRPVEHNQLSEWDFLYNKAHNEWLNHLANSGAIGLISYLSPLVIYLLWLGYHILKPTLNTRTKLIFTAQAAGIVALEVSNFLGFSTVSVTLIRTLFPVISILLISDVQHSQARSKKSHVEKNVAHANTSTITPPIYIALAIIGFISLYFAAAPLKMLQADIAYNQGKSLADTPNLIQSVQLLEQAVLLAPREAVYTDEFALTLAKAASGLQAMGQASQAASIASQAALLSNLTLELNPIHLNFYKNRARTFIYLSSVDPEYQQFTSSTLFAASKLAPSDPKLIYNLAVLSFSQQNYDQALEYMLQSLALKPDYIDARNGLGTLYETLNQPADALEQYQYIVDFISPNDELVLAKIASLSGELK